MEANNAKSALISSVGLNKDPVITTIKLFKPDIVCFIITESSRNTLNDVVEATKLKPNQYETYVVDDAPTSIGNLIRKYYSAYKWLTTVIKVPKDNIHADPTGGRKWMSAGMVMAASLINTPLYYVDVDYVKGKPVPGTEKLIDLGNAYKQTGFLHFARGRDLFNAYEFNLASQAFGKLESVFPDELTLYRGLTDLSDAFHQWDLFIHYQKDLSNEIHNAFNQINIGLKYLDSISNGFESFVSQLRTVADNIIRIHNESKPSILAIADLLANAKRQITKKRFDGAAARTYRALEGLAQLLLKEQYGIETSKPNYDSLTQEQREAVVKVVGSFPSLISLDVGWLILHALGNSIAVDMYNIDKNGRYNNKLGGVLSARNNSIYAHGWTPIEEGKAVELHTKVCELASKIEGFDEHFKGLELPEMPSLWE